MEKVNKLTFRRINFINRFERTCNFVLLHLCPIYSKENNYYEALVFAKKSLAEEKRTLKQVKAIMREKRESQVLISGLLEGAEINQNERHKGMQKIIERK